jgi:hypothetical protein
MPGSYRKLCAVHGRHYSANLRFENPHAMELRLVGQSEKLHYGPANGVALLTCPMAPD